MQSDIRLCLLVGANRWSGETVLEVHAGSADAAALDVVTPEAWRNLESWLSEHHLATSGAVAADRIGWAEQLGALTSTLRLFAGMEPYAYHVGDDGACLALVCDEQSFACLCVEAAQAMRLVAIRNSGRNQEELAAILRSFAEHVVDLGLDPAAVAVMQAAERLKLPFRRHSLLRGHYLLGEGRNQIVLDATDTNRTSAMGKSVAANKDLCNALLTAYGFPTARQELIQDASEVWAAAQSVGLPAVIKPRMGSRGRGITLDVKSGNEALAAFETARKVRPEILVESTLPGDDHRVMVVGDGVIALRRLPPAITGDGMRTIADLVERENRDRLAAASGLGAIQINEDTQRRLSAAGLNLDSVLAASQIHVLQSIPNASWRRHDVSASVHPENRRMLVDVARLIGLDIASIDFRTPDISRPWQQTGGGICEVETQAALWALMRADAELVQTFLRYLVVGRRVCIPQVLVVGDGEPEALDQQGQMLGQMCSDSFGWTVALQSANGLTIGGQVVPCSTPGEAQIRAVEHPAVDAAIYINSAQSSRADGLGVERPDLVVLADALCEGDLADICARSGAHVLPWSRQAEAEAFLRSFDSVVVRSDAPA